MHHIEPCFTWRDYYRAEDDLNSPFFNREYSEFTLSNRIYDRYIHPQWDDFGSPTLYLKILYTDYVKGFTIIEFLGEWNDCINNDIMFLWEEIIKSLISKGIFRFILLGENVLNFHYSDDSYYEAWKEELVEEDGWIVALNFRKHVIEEMQIAGIDKYIFMGDHWELPLWRTLEPVHVFLHVESSWLKVLGMAKKIKPA